MSNSLKTVPPRCAARRLRFGAKGLFHLAADDHDHDRKYDKDDKTTTHEVMGGKKKKKKKKRLNTEEIHEVMTGFKI